MTQGKIEIVRRSLAPGLIFSLFCNFTHPPKPKILLLLTVDAYPRVFAINTNIPSLIQKVPGMLQTQVLLERRQHPFLTHDSYVDCSKAIQVNGLSLPDLKSELINNISAIKGRISPNARALVVEAIRSSSTLERRMKRDLSECLIGP